MYFDGSDVDLSESADEDVAGVSIDAVTGDIYLSTRGAFSVPNVSGGSSDVFVCKPSALGSTTSCGFESYWVGSLHGLTSNDVIGIHIERAGSSANRAPTVSFTWAATDFTIDFIATGTGADESTTVFLVRGTSAVGAGSEPWRQSPESYTPTITPQVTLLRTKTPRQIGAMGQAGVLDHSARIVISGSTRVPRRAGT